jgi:hypothetical protein
LHAEHLEESMRESLKQAALSDQIGLEAEKQTRYLDDIERRRRQDQEGDKAPGGQADRRTDEQDTFFYINSERIFEVVKSCLQGLWARDGHGEFSYPQIEDVLGYSERFVREWRRRREESRTAQRD